MSRLWPALLIEAPALDDPPDAEERLAAVLDDLEPQAIEDLGVPAWSSAATWESAPASGPEALLTPLRWRVFFASAEARDRASRVLADELPRLSRTAVDVADEDWAARSQASLRAVAAGRFIVAPPWDIPPTTPQSATTTIVIEPSTGFGTGHHATTRLCLRLLSDLPLRGARVLDVGTGSGVLAMAAAFSGAAEVVGLDVDPDAIEAARASARLNALPGVIRFEVADFRAGWAARADVVVANLTGGLLRAAARELSALVASGGMLIVSGFEHAEAADVRAAFDVFPLSIQVEEEGWVALRLQQGVRS